MRTGNPKIYFITYYFKFAEGNKKIQSDFNVEIYLHLRMKIYIYIKKCKHVKNIGYFYSFFVPDSYGKSLI